MIHTTIFNQRERRDTQRTKANGPRIVLSFFVLRHSHFPPFFCVLCVLCGAIFFFSAAIGMADDEADLGPGVNLTVYNQNFAIVKERRSMTFAQGAGTVKFGDVAATIEPESVQFSALDLQAPVNVLEQNYEFDLVSADKLLEKYIDKKITVVNRDGGLIDGTLMASDPTQLVLATRNGIDLVPRYKNVKDIRFSSLPGGLLTKPTLVWKVNAKRGGEQLIKVAYRANNVNWRVDYRAVAATDEKTLDLAGWVTINNNSGTTFKDAGIKLLAGDVNLVQDQEGRNLTGRSESEKLGDKRGKGGAFVEKSFSEYHLYTLGRTTTVASAQTKQIELINIETIPVEKKFLYRPEFGNRVGVALEFKNAKKTIDGLGVPLPKGPIRVYQRDADGQAELAGQDSIDHTPKDEVVRIRTGYAFDLVVERLQVDNRQNGGERWIEQTFSIKLRNHKDRAVTVVAEEPLLGYVNWDIIAKSQEFVKKDFRTLDFSVDVPANEERIVTYTARYTW